MELAQSPVKEAALRAGLEVMQPEKARDPSLHERLSRLAPDAAVVVAYGKILPATLLDIPRLGFVNVHFSLLPEYRGAAPVQRALMDGVKRTGVSIMVLTEGMDEGPVLATEAIEVADDDTAGALGRRLADVGARVLVRALHDYASRDVQPVPQDEARATYAPKITSAEARIEWTRPAESIRNQVRALNPAPGAWTTFRDLRLKVFAVERADRIVLPPGGLRADRELVVSTSDGALALRDVQLAGKRRMTGGELARGLRIHHGERLA
jgi:methionyl-tRNA formyltransferase